MNELIEAFAEDQRRITANSAKAWFQALIQGDQYVGEVYSISYETALVQIHDFYRQRVGGIPSLSFLIATRVNLEEENDYTLEDSCVILLRVMDAALLPNSAEAERIRVETAQRVSGDLNVHWDERDVMDPATHNLLSFAGIKCRVIGTFFLDRDPNDAAGELLALHFGSDISNYYPNRGLKVFKPNGQALSLIVNYRDINRSDLRSQHEVTIGEVRYASTNRAFQGISNVEVKICPADLLGQKTALFGMTRTGKSNTTKIIAKSVFDLRFDPENPLRIGQIIFDPDGEYANENVQDSNTALKNVWRSNAHGDQNDVVTYGISPHPDDPNRRLMLLNFYEDANLQLGKEIIDNILADDSSKYIQNFRQVVFERPDPRDRSATTRYNRRVLAYRALLAKAGFDSPRSIQPQTRGLFNSKLLEHMRNSNGTNAADHASAANIFANARSSWQQLATAFTYLYDFMSDKKSGYQAFEQWYINDRPNASGETWADEDLKKILEMINRPNGARQIGKAINQHSSSTTTDYAADIYNDLVAGRLVIVDQSSGDSEINASSARRIMRYIFRENQSRFREGQEPPDILVYIEEAHNLLPAGGDLDLQDVWVRTAKEGAKYRTTEITNQFYFQQRTRCQLPLPSYLEIRTTPLTRTPWQLNSA